MNFLRSIVVPDLSFLRDPVLARAVRKAALRLVPFLLLLYILAFLDRVNIGYAKQAYLRDTGMSEMAFAFGAGIFFVSYALFQIPANLVLHRIGARIWFCRIMIVWGLISAATMLARTPASFYAMRFLLGVAEAGFFPGVIFYLTLWFPSRIRVAMIGVFYFGPPLAQILGGPISGLLLDLNGVAGLKGWQCMFLIEGLLAVPAGIWTARQLTDRPADAGWLEPEERTALQAAMEAEERVKMQRGRVGSLATLRQPRVLYLGMVYWLLEFAVYGVAFYLPSQVAGLLGRETGFVVGTVSAIPWLGGAVAVYAAPRLVAKYGRRTQQCGLSLALGAMGIVIATSSQPVIGLLGLCLAAGGFQGCQPVFWSLPADELSGLGAAGGIALINSMGTAGGFFAPNLKTWAEQAFHSPSAGLWTLAIAAFLGAGCMFAFRERRIAVPAIAT